ncbi:hypothetical protein KP509_21G034900 [Ceratopteris richardii]|uniref:Secreted protein n=1 Tax=Ceratopteris richardii TaxID=49495 RepID=A0A8T2SAC1_CERRI|nr:hypothetical protein KP509_21G034900 [Ceratopteris richardii]
MLVLTFLLMVRVKTASDLCFAWERPNVRFEPNSNSIRSPRGHSSHDFQTNEIPDSSPPGGLLRSVVGSALTSSSPRGWLQPVVVIPPRGLHNNQWSLVERAMEGRH